MSSVSLSPTAGPALPVAVRRRPEHAGDAPFLLDLFAESHGAILAGLEPALRETLMRQQLAGQAMTYRATYPRARFDIVECESVAVGRIVTDVAADAATLVDIALRADWRGRGIGTRLIEDLAGEAALRGAPVRLTVRAANAGARRLYARLGFVPIAATEIDVHMERRPPARRTDDG